MTMTKLFIALLAAVGLSLDAAPAASADEASFIVRLASRSA